MDEPFQTRMFASHDAVELAFYEALERADLEGVMACWAEEEDIVSIHPNGPRLVGPHAIRSSYAHILGRGGLPIKPLALHVQLSLMSAVHSLVEEIAVSEPGGVKARAHAFATNIYAKTPVGWRLVMHHASPVSLDLPTESIDDIRHPGVLH